MRLEWTDSWSVGVPRLDEEHRQLIDLINELRSLHEDGIEGRERQVRIHSVMSELSWYAESHFRFEEGLMANAEYPDLVAHRASHLLFRVQLSKLATEVKDGSADLLDLYGFLAGWIRFHVLESDLQYAPFLLAVNE